jgi:hypothetical protein
MPIPTKRKRVGTQNSVRISPWKMKRQYLVTSWESLLFLTAPHTAKTVFFELAEFSWFFGSLWSGEFHAGLPRSAPSSIAFMALSERLFYSRTNAWKASKMTSRMNPGEFLLKGAGKLGILTFGSQCQVLTFGSQCQVLTFGSQCQELKCEITKIVEKLNSENCQI